MREAYTAIDFFAGAGGLSQGFVEAGFAIALAVDEWEVACSTYKANHPQTIVWQKPIGSDTAAEEILAHAGLDAAPTIVIGGPPCQGFSTLGKRLHRDERNTLVWEFARLVTDIRPRWFLMENVEGLRLAKKENRHFIDEILETFARAGYSTSSGIVMAAQYGVPQLRSRVFVVGNREGVAFQFPSPKYTEVASFVTAWQAISDLPSLTVGGRKTSYAARRPNAFQKSLRKQSGALTLHEASHHPKHLVAAIRHIPDGGNRQSIPAPLRPQSGFHNSYARFASWRPAVAVTTVTGKISTTRSLHPFDDRAITPREAARLQTFRDDYLFEGERGDVYAQIGNSVPPLLAQRFAEQILRYLADRLFEPTAEEQMATRKVVREAKEARPQIQPPPDSIRGDIHHTPNRPTIRAARLGIR